MNKQRVYAPIVHPPPLTVTQNKSLYLTMLTVGFVLQSEQEANRGWGVRDNNLAHLPLYKEPLLLSADEILHMIISINISEM